MNCSYNLVANGGIMKKICLSTLSLILLVACNNNASVSNYDDNTNNKVVVQQSGFYKDFIYVDGKRVSVDINKLNENQYVVFYHGKEVTIDNGQLQNLKDTQNQSSLFKPKKLSDYKIISYKKHGDHWHIKTTEGEFISYQDPTKLSKQQLSKITKPTTANNKIIKSYKHGDHWHLVLDDGREIISYTDPNKSNISIPEKNNSTKNIYVVNTYKHGDHWHIVYSDGHEEISYTNPNPSNNNVSENNNVNVKYNFLISGQLPKYNSSQKLALKLITNHPDIVEIKWYLDDQEIFKGKELVYQLTLADNHKKLIAKGYDKNHICLLESSPFELIVNESIIGEIDGILDHYHTDDILKLSINFNNPAVKKYRWLLKKDDSRNFELINESVNNYLHSNFKLNASYHRSVIKVEGLDSDNHILVSSNPVKIFINDHKHSPMMSGDPELGKKSLIEAGIDERLVYSLMVGQSDLPFPGKELTSQEVDEYLNSVHAINLRKSENPLEWKGIERLVNLESLDISYTTGINNLSIKTLLKFTKLRDLNLSYTDITDLSFLSAYKNLIGVSLMGMNINEISFLEKMPMLEKLNLSYNDISDPSPISRLIHLTHIGMDKTNIKNLDFLRPLNNLVQVSVDDNSINDLSALKHKNLKSLYVSYTNVVDFSSLGNMDSLLALYAINDQVESLSQFKNLKNLELLDVSSNKISNFDGLENLVMLETLNVNNNKLLKSLKLNKPNNSVTTLKMNRSGLESLEHKSMWKKLSNFSYSSTPALENELGDIENIGSNSVNIVYYDGINYALLHNDHTHIYNQPLKVNDTNINFNAKTDKIVGLSNTGYYVNRFLKKLSDGSDFYNLYHINGNIDFAFELPDSMNDKYKPKQEYIDRVINYRLKIVEDKINIAINKDELLVKYQNICSMLNNNNDKLIALNKLESEIVIKKDDNSWANKGEKINKYYLEVKEKLSFFEQFQFDLQYESFQKALVNNNEDVLNKTYTEMVNILKPYGFTAN